MRREEARSGPGKLQLERGANEKRSMKGRLQRGQRHRRKTRKRRGFGERRYSRHYPSPQREAVGYDWTPCVGFGTKKVSSAP